MAALGVLACAPLFGQVIKPVSGGYVPMLAVFFATMAATRRGRTIAAQNKEIGSQASEREQRERLLAPARGAK